MLKSKEIAVSFLMITLFFAVSCESETERIVNDDIEWLLDVNDCTAPADPLRTMAVIDSLKKETDDSIRCYYLYCTRGNTYMADEQYDSVLFYYDKSKKYIESVEDNRKYIYLSALYNYYVLFFSMCNENDSVILYAEKNFNSLQLCETVFALDVINSGLNLGDCYRQVGKPVEALKWYRDMLSFADSVGCYKYEKLTIYLSLMFANLDIKNEEQADYYRDIIEMDFDKLSKEEKYAFFMNLGNYCMIADDYQKALDITKRIRLLIPLFSEDENYDYIKQYCYLNLGEAYMMTGRLDSADIYLDGCYDFFQSIGNQTALFELENIKLKRAFIEHDYPLVKELIKNADENGVDKYAKIERLRYLTKIYSSEKDYEKAYNSLRQYYELKDSMSGELVKMKYDELDLRYKQDTVLLNKNIVIANQKSRVATLHTQIYVWAFVSLLLLLAAVFFYLYHIKQKTLVAERNKRNMVLMRMQSIRNRISPHFILNVLNRELYHRQLDDGVSEIEPMVQILYKNLKLVDEYCITLDEELDFIKLYVELEKKAFSEGCFDFEINVESGIDSSKITIPSMILQIIVENAVKHALRGKPGFKMLIIDVVKDDGKLMISVCDNGGGYQSHPLNVSKSTGTGMKVITQTIQLLNSYNKEPMMLNIENVPVNHGLEIGCKVILTIPEGFVFSI